MSLEFQLEDFGGHVLRDPSMGRTISHCSGITTEINHTIFTDASGKALGAWLNNEWLVSEIPIGITVGGHNRQNPIPTDSTPSTLRVSSGHAEAAAIHMALLAFSPSRAGSHIMIRTDSSVVVGAWGTLSTPSPAIASFIRAYALIGSKWNITISISHIPGSQNIIADHISRLQGEAFRLAHPSAQQFPLQPPSQAAIWLSVPR